jgi:hypothetical protein
VTKKSNDLTNQLNEAISVATSVAYTKKEIEKLKTELYSLLEKKSAETIVEYVQVPGPPGQRGLIGSKGDKGDKGDSGDAGPVGPKGDKGEVGPQGNMGLEGPRGLKGDKGDKGDTGAVGPQGEQGIQGIAGERGEKGEKGDRGADGKNGLDGRDGQTGAVGPVGPIGTQGVQGERGLKGDKGERGQDGQQGIQGPAGPRGEVGPQGVQGLPGKDGKDADIKPVEDKFQKFIDNVQKDVSAFKTKVNATILKSGPNDAWKATGSGEVNLRYLDDVNRDSIQNDYVLSYNSTNNNFEFIYDTLDRVTDRGNTTTNGIQVANVLANYFQVRTDVNLVPTEGQIVWGETDRTFQIGLAYGTTVNLGEETHIFVKATEPIAKGNLIMFNGVQGENLLARKYDPSVPGFIPSWFIGVAKNTMATNGFGYALTVGQLNGLNTNGFNAGDILWADNTIPGGLTKVEPIAPGPKIQVAAVTKKSGGDGQLQVRVTINPRLEDLSNVEAQLPANSDILVYISANSRWQHLPASQLFASVTVDGVARVIAGDAYNQANSSFSTANLALSIANSAFAQANTGGAAGTDNVARSIANSAFSTANLALSIANSAFAQANTGGGGAATDSLNIIFNNHNATAYKVVAINADSETILASTLDLTQANKVVGILDANNETVTLGTLTNPAWTWTADQTLYLSSNGDIVTTPTIDGATFSLKVGYSLSATKVFVKIGTPVVL